MDALGRKKTDGRKQFDRKASTGGRGKVPERLLEAMLGDPYFKMAPPKSTGRERFGREFVNGLIATGVAAEDLIATAAEFTARSIVLAVPARVELIASGGGGRHRWLMRRLVE